MKQWILLTGLLFCSACQLGAAPEPTPGVEEVPMVEPFVEPTATPDCQHAEGVTFEVQRIRDTTVKLLVGGLRPGEKPMVIYSTFVTGERSAMTEMYDFAQGADQSGEFSVGLPGLRPLEGQTSATWDIRFIHGRGVECTTITLH